MLEQGFSAAEAVTLLNMDQGTLAYWATQARTAGKNTPVKVGAQSPAELAAENKQLRKELAEVRMERDILKKRRRTLPGSHCPVHVRETMTISISGQAAVPGSGGISLRVYAWLKRSLCRRAQENERLRVEIRAAHAKTRRTYSTKRLQDELADEGIKAGRDRIARLRREEGIHCIQKRKFKATTNSNHSLPVAHNLLNQEFKPTKLNEVWVRDITYISTDEGWLYLAGIKDVFTCEIVDYAMGSRMTQELVSQALWKAVKRKRPEAGLILHSDRGSPSIAHTAIASWLSNSNYGPPCRGEGIATTTQRWKASGVA